MAGVASPAKWQEWEDRFARFERKGPPIRQFCEAEGVKPGTFWYGRWHLAGNRERNDFSQRHQAPPVEQKIVRTANRQLMVRVSHTDTAVYTGVHRLVRPIC